MFSRMPYYAEIIAECSTVLDVIIFVCVMKPSAFYSLCTIPLISATVDIRNTVLKDSGRGSLERLRNDEDRWGGRLRGRAGREERMKGEKKEEENEHGWE